ncbi:MAG: hypothetical protein ACREOG_19885, partial [Gemmatimonadaceae bacterium]
HGVGERHTTESLTNMVHGFAATVPAFSMRLATPRHPHAVSGYTFDQLWLDYRRCIVRNLTTPLLFWSRGIKPEDWPRLLYAAVSAYADLECDEVL